MFETSVITLGAIFLSMIIEIVIAIIDDDNDDDPGSRSGMVGMMRV